MCSSPKGSSSTSNRRKSRIAIETPEEYQAYAQMLRNASACYERSQQRKKERRLTENKPASSAKGQ